MQTFLPYSDFYKSIKCLDYKRLGKQRVEAKQILNALRGKSKGWVNHPATKMWKGYEDALSFYHNLCILEWTNRGFNNTMELEIVGEEMNLPIWLGNEDFHNSHKSNLLRKDPIFYGKFGWNVPHDLPYIWPVK